MERKLQELLWGDDENKILTPADMVRTLIEYVQETTAASRRYMEANPGRNQSADYEKYPGKLDHATALVVQAASFYG